MTIRAVKFEIEFTESACFGDHTLFNSFAEVDAALRRIGRRAPVGGAYDKTFVTVTYEDGYVYKARLDVTPDGEHDLGEHIRRHNEFYAGRRCPPHITPERYAEFLAATPQEAKDHCREFLDAGYATSDPDPEPSRDQAEMALAIVRDFAKLDAGHFGAAAGLGVSADVMRTLHSAAWLSEKARKVLEGAS